MNAVITSSSLKKLVMWNKVRELKDRKSTRLNSSHVRISYAVFCLKKKINTQRSLAAVPAQNERLAGTLRDSRDHILPLTGERDPLAQPPDGFVTFLSRYVRHSLEG